MKSRDNVKSSVDHVITVEKFRRSTLRARHFFSERLSGGTFTVKGRTPLRTFPIPTRSTRLELELLRTQSPRTRDPPTSSFSFHPESLVGPERRQVGCLSQLFNRQNPFEGRKTRVSEGPLGSRVHRQDSNFGPE